MLNCSTCNAFPRCCPFCEWSLFTMWAVLFVENQLRRASILISLHNEGSVWSCQKIIHLKTPKYIALKKLVKYTKPKLALFTTHTMCVPWLFKEWMLMNKDGVTVPGLNQDKLWYICPLMSVTKFSQDFVLP